MEEAQLIQQIVNGRPEAFRYLYRLHATSAWKLALYICERHEIAEDIVQNSFINAFRFIYQFQQNSSFKTWLLRIVYNEALKAVQKEKTYRYEEHVPMILTSETISIEYDLEQKDLQKQVQKCLGKLKEPEALVLKLFYLEQLKIVEIGAITGWTVSHIKVLLHRARKHFKIHFENLRSVEP